MHKLRKSFVIFILLAFSTSVYAQIPERKLRNLPEGTFKKARNGTIVQYDKNGKKIGQYKLDSRRYVKTK